MINDRLDNQEEPDYKEPPEIIDAFDETYLPQGQITVNPVPAHDPSKHEKKTRIGFGSLVQKLTIGALLAVTGLLSFLFVTTASNTGTSNGLVISTNSASSSTGSTVFSTQMLDSASSTQAELTVQQVVQEVRPAVVQITNQQQVSTGSTSRSGSTSGQQSSGGTTQDTGVGSGIIYDQSGYILTNYHVVEGADSLLVALTDGRTFSGKVVGSDPVTDLAVVKIDPAGSELPVAELGDSSALQVGDGLVAIGNALALEGGPTVTTGVVSALDRSVTEPATDSQTQSGNSYFGSATTSSAGTQLYDLIQTDAAINPGNSGGPLVNMYGQVVGINTLAAGEVEQGVQAEGIGFAISIDQAKEIAQQLVSSGSVSHAMLGITSQPLTAAMATSLNLNVTQGTVVVQVQSGSAASQAGLVKGDVITAIDGQKLTGESTLGEIINSHKPGDKVQLEVITPQSSGGNGQARTVEVTLGQRTAS
jgi:S1-C subfamily serine protease